MSLRLSQLMLQYFTVERTTEFILKCEAEGINTLQTSFTPVVRDALRAARERGSKIQYLCLSSDRPTLKFQDILDVKPIAICHHGVDTDRLIRAGQMQKVRDYVNRVHDAGLPAGVSTHNPDHLARIEDAGWETGFYMTCCYDIYRPAEEIKARMGDDILGEVYLASDPARMLARVRQIKKTVSGVQDPGGGAAMRQPAIARERLPLRLRQHQTGRRNDRRHVPHPHRRSEGRRRPGPPNRGQVRNPQLVNRVIR